ncbi:fimbrial protein [Serratia fonticola]|uniref:fimbrial protein n=1 Tax=Serratia fonticola TaxID=47917 RepID=UPI000E0F7831|nr:fimbrial protein [Serratia fonticola]RDL22720.1 minor fimbrial subunit [Serratia fonticola]
MEKIILIILLMGCSFNSLATTCIDLTGQTISDKDESVVNVYVDIRPSISAGENMVVNLSNSISCKDRYKINGGNGSPVFFYFARNSGFTGELSKYAGYLEFVRTKYSLPLGTETFSYYSSNYNYTPLSAKLIITPDSSARGVVIPAGSNFAVLYVHMMDRGPDNNGPVTLETYTWNLIANNSVVIPTGTCDVSARNVTVSLPDYPASTPVPISVNCLKNQQLSYYLSGTTEDAGNTVFRNTASASAAQGVGIQITGNGKVIPANSNVSLGNVGESSVELGLTASYARTSGPLTAGNVQSIIGVTFVYQ